MRGAAPGGSAGAGRVRNDPPRAATIPAFQPAVEAVDLGAGRSAAADAGSAGGRPAALPGEEPAVRILLPGDRLVMTLSMYPKSETLDRVIDENGAINLDLVGRIKVGGKTAAEAEKIIEKAYVDGQFYKTITVSIILPVREFFVKGYVLRQGNYPISPTKTTLLQALTMAGGWNEFADPSKIRLIRGEEIIILNALKIQARTEPDVYIEPGDVIDVPKRWM
jgi:polysaccharide export outer membrane protein